MEELVEEDESEEEEGLTTTIGNLVSIAKQRGAYMQPYHMWLLCDYY